MRARLIIPPALLLGLALAIAEAADDSVFPFDRAARVDRIELELRQLQGEQQRLADERRELIRERACVARAPSREAMRACSRPRP